MGERTAAAIQDRRLIGLRRARDTGGFMLVLKAADGCVKPKTNPRVVLVKLAFDTLWTWRDGAPEFEAD